MKILDYIVVGSGCSGAMAAQTLVEKGLQVTMLDVGDQPAADAPPIPDLDYLSLRQTDAKQYQYLVGEGAHGVGWGKIGKGEQVTPPRSHMLKSARTYLPVESDSFSPLESLGYGGLGIGWGLQCWEYSPADLQTAGLNTKDMPRAYQVVADRIGISANQDDASSYTVGSLKDYQPSPKIDRNHSYLQSKYVKHKSSFQRQGFYLGRTPLALLTKDFNDRQGYAYRDMDFYSDNDQSAWRPWMTVDALRQQSNFDYRNGYLALRFAEKKSHTEIECLDIHSGKTRIFACRKLILATSALGSARLVLRSLGDSKTRLPLLCNPYSYVPCLQPRFFGQAAEPGKLGFTQLSLFYDPGHQNSGASVASLYGYQSLMLFRIIRHVPLNFKDARLLMRYLLPAMVIAGIHHPDASSPNKYLKLTADKTSPTGDRLQANFSLTNAEQDMVKRREQSIIRALRSMGTFSLKRIDPGFGASIHYAGTLPFSESEKPFQLHPSGRLHGTRGIYVADSSGFNYLPAPGLTFSLMANAHLVAESAI